MDLASASNSPRFLAGGVIAATFGAMTGNAFRRIIATGRCLIHSIRASVAEPSVVAGSLVLAAGEMLHLPCGQRMTLVSGRLWVTHAGDGRDFFPAAGASLQGGDRTLLEAMSITVLQSVAAAPQPSRIDVARALARRRMPRSIASGAAVE